MNEEHFIMVSLEDSASKVIAEVLGSKTCKKIISCLADINEASEKDLADKLALPINTVEYNLKKLVESGFVQKRKNFFWSKKGKKIPMYELTNKSIVLSPRRKISEKIKSIVPAFILTLTGTFSVWVYEKINSVPGSTAGVNYAQDAVYSTVESVGPEIMKTSIVAPKLISDGQGITTIVQTAANNNQLWIWFLAGALIATTIILIINWRKL